MVSLYGLGGFHYVGFESGFFVYFFNLLNCYLDINYLIQNMKNINSNIIASFLIHISIQYGVASLNLPVNYPQLPANPIR